MAIRKPGIPSYLLHKPSGRAITVLRHQDGKRRQIYLGLYDSPESHRKYREVLASYLDRSRVVTTGTQKQNLHVTVAEFVARFLAWAEGYYRKPDGSPTREFPNFVRLEPMWQVHVQSGPPRVPELTGLFSRTTDADGRAVLPRLPLPVGQRVRDANRHQRVVANYVAVARARGYIPSKVSVKISLDDFTEVEITLRKKREVMVKGRVLTTDGKPAVGITVRNGAKVSDTTDQSGHYALEPHAYWRQARLIVEGPKVPRMISLVEIPQDGSTVEHDIVVELRAPVTGRVVDQRGMPVAGVKILLGVERGTHYRSTPELTGEDGRFAFPDAIPSHDHVWIMRPEPRAAWESERSRKLSRRDGEEIVLQRFTGQLVDLRVTVVDGDTGRLASPSLAKLTALHGDSRILSSLQLRLDLGLGKVTASSIRPGRYRLIVRTTDGHRAEQVIELTAGLAQDVRIELWRPATVMCSLDMSGLSDAEAASIDSFVVVLRPNREQSYAVDEQGERLAYTENTGILKPGRLETFWLVRVTPNTPLCLRTLGRKYFAEIRFTAKPNEETHVKLRPRKQGVLAFHVPASLPQGAFEIDVDVDVAGEGEVWRPVRHVNRPVEKVDRLEVQRAPGSVRWRLRFWGKGGEEPIVHTGTHQVRSGVTTEVAWSAK